MHDYPEGNHDPGTRRSEVDSVIPVTRPYLPSRERLDAYIDGIYERGWLTNNGVLVQELTRRLETHLGVENLLLVANGTLALQIAYRALGVTPEAHGGVVEAVTTPFSFVATASSLAWESVKPSFADIDPDTWCLDPNAVELAITPQTRAIVPVHVFGNACDVNAIDDIAHRRGLKVVYDAAHAFGVGYRGGSVLRYGDAATLSFHATKLFHTIEGGAIVFRRADDLERARAMINFGITGPVTIEGLGINAKMNEFQAAMGLAVLDEMDVNMRARRAIWQAYDDALCGHVQRQARTPDASNNYAYVPVLLGSEAHVEKAQAALRDIDVHARRYFFPSLETVDYLGGHAVHEHSNDVAGRILCLPIYVGLTKDDVERIVATVKRAAS